MWSLANLNYFAKVITRTSVLITSLLHFINVNIFYLKRPKFLLIVQCSSIPVMLSSILSFLFPFFLLSFPLTLARSSTRTFCISKYGYHSCVQTHRCCGSHYRHWRYYITPLLGILLISCQGIHLDNFNLTFDFVLSNSSYTHHGWTLSNSFDIILTVFNTLKKRRAKKFVSKRYKNRTNASIIGNSHGLW